MVDKQNQKKSTINRLIVVSLIVAVISSLVTSAIVGGVVYYQLYRITNSRESQRQTVVQEGEVIADIAAELSPSVVSVTTSQTTRGINQYFQEQQQISQGAGTGIIVDPGGLVLTNKHVIPDETTDVDITLADGTLYKNVTVLGRDPLNDLALLQIKNPKKLTAAKLGNSDSVRTGEKVIAIGNALGEFQNTVTSGIISGVGRPIEASDGNGSSEQLTNLFQTDAAINPGNSGGPLVNFNGEVIGINTAIAQGAQGLGFSIPINEAKPIVTNAQKTGKLSRAYLGVKYVTLTPQIADKLKLDVKSGAYIDKQPTSVVSGSPADKAGIKPGDVIVKIDNVKLDSKKQLSTVVGRFSVGQKVLVTINRDGKTVNMEVTLAEAPSN